MNLTAMFQTFEKEHLRIYVCWCKKVVYLAGAEKSPQRSELGLGWTTVLELLLSSSSKQPANIDKQCKLQVVFQWISCSQKLS